MKRALSLLLLAFPVWLWAQPSLNEQTAYLNLPGTVQKTITREWKFPTPITYVETDTKHYFVHYIGGNSSATVVEINPNITVNDFVVDLDSVFMCGTTASGDGFFGFFGINDFFFGSHAYTITGFTFNASSGYIPSFDKVASYLYNGERRYVAIGQTSLGDYATTEMWINSSLLTGVYRVGVLPSIYNETLMDVAVTNGYVVTVGYKMNGTISMPSIRVYLKTGIFSSFGTQDHRTVFMPSTSPIGDFDGSQLLIANMAGNDYAIAAYWKPSPGAINSGIYVGKYNVGNNNMAGHWASIYATAMTNYGGWALRGLTPSDANYNIFLLHNALNPATGQLDSKIFEIGLFSFNTPFTVNVRIGSTPLLQNLDANSTTPGFVSSGILINGLHDLWYNMGIVGQYNCCYHQNENYMYVTMTDSQEHDPFQINGDNASVFQTYTGIATQVTVTTNCIN